MARQRDWYWGCITRNRRTLRTVSNDENPDIPCEERLEASQLEIQRLSEQNAQLTEASNAFGQLAERLNLELQQELRLGEPDRRRSPRSGAVERRTLSAQRP